MKDRNDKVVALWEKCGHGDEIHPAITDRVLETFVPAHIPHDVEGHKMFSGDVYWMSGGHVIYQNEIMELVRTDLKDDVCTSGNITSSYVAKRIGNNYGARVKPNLRKPGNKLFAVIDSFSDG